MTSNNETVSGQKIKSRAELRILWTSEVEHTPIYQNILKMNPCHGLSVISLDWITVYCSLTCRRNVDSCKICCDDDGEDKVGCDAFAQYFYANCLRVDYHPFFLSPLIANGTNYFCLTNHIQWEADHWLLRENQRHFMELNSVREFFRAKSVSSIEADDHFKEAADAKTKHHIWNTRPAKYHL